MKKIQDLQTKQFLRWHISWCYALMLCVSAIALLNTLTADSHSSLSGSSSEIQIICTAGFELPDDAASRPCRVQIKISREKNLFPAGTLPEFLPGKFLSPQNFSHNARFRPGNILPPTPAVLLPAVPVRAGPQNKC